MKDKLLIIIIIFTHTIIVFPQKDGLSWPDITHENKPWTRWWWPGNIVSPGDITANMEKYSEAGLGGLEITSIYGVRGHEDKFIDYLTPEWMEMFTHTLREAERLDLGIDLANASGWPFGGPWVDSSDACKNIYYRTYSLNSGEKLNKKIEFTQPLEIRPVGNIPDKNKRVLSDYRQTISDLILEKFTGTWTNWAHRQGKITRNQAHGSPGNILDLYAAADIPETEGTDILSMKFASSAASVTGKQYVSCETATWLDEHFTSTLSDIKNAADISFLAGVNHIFYHGTCYSPVNEPWPGFLFYASTEINPSNPLWNNIRALNEYITRIQSFLQTGRPDNDILLYYPIFDQYADPGTTLLKHFSGMDKSSDGTKFRNGADSMFEKGYTFDYISDLQIINTEYYDEYLVTEGNIYKVLVIPECDYIPVETFSHILRLAYEGAHILFYGELPGNIAGWAFKEEKTSFYNQLKARINFTPTNNPEVFKSVYGNGTILRGNNLEQLLSFSGIKRETMSDNNLMFVRRQTQTGFIYFICNKGEKAFEGWAPLNLNSLSAAILNPMDGRSGLAKQRISKSGQTEIYLRLFPGESLIIAAYNFLPDAEPYTYYDNLSIAKEITGTWKVEFIDGGPVLPAVKEIDELISWTEFEDTTSKDFSGTALYTINFIKPKAKADAWAINFAAKYRQNIKDGIFDASSWEPRESGLLGPVTLTPLKRIK